MEYSEIGLRTKIWRVPPPRRNGNASQRHIKKAQGKRASPNLGEGHLAMRAPGQSHCSNPRWPGGRAVTE
jgi:hypothetical protein